jgi:hypothetical protein
MCSPVISNNENYLIQQQPSKSVPMISRKKQPTNENAFVPIFLPESADITLALRKSISPSIPLPDRLLNRAPSRTLTVSPALEGENSLLLTQPLETCLFDTSRVTQKSSRPESVQKGIEEQELATFQELLKQIQKK